MRIEWCLVNKINGSMPILTYRTLYSIIDSGETSRSSLSPCFCSFIPSAATSVGFKASVLKIMITLLLQDNSSNTATESNLKGVAMRLAAASKGGLKGICEPFGDTCISPCYYTKDEF